MTAEQIGNKIPKRFDDGVPTPEISARGLDASQKDAFAAILGVTPLERIISHKQSGETHNAYRYFFFQGPEHRTIDTPVNAILDIDFVEGQVTWQASPSIEVKPVVIKHVDGVVGGDDSVVFYGQDKDFRQFLTVFRGGDMIHEVRLF